MAKIPNLVCVKREESAFSSHGDSMFAYFRDAPSEQELHIVQKNACISEEFKKTPFRQDDAISRIAELQRWYLGEYEP